MHLPNEIIFRGLGGTAIPLSFLVLTPKHVPLPVVIVGTVVMSGGLALVLWSQATLGRNWIGGIGLRKGHKLITSGPYSMVRNPLYTGIAIVIVGGAIACMNPLLIPAGALFWLSMAIRVPSEEELMQKKFRKQWDAYVASTGCFVPRFRR